MALMRGALVEYGTDLLGPIPNVVVFQFNPEKLLRTFNIPAPAAAAAGAAQRQPTERGQTAAPPTETLTITAHFSAADELAQSGATAELARAFGIGPQLAALEKMVYPPQSGLTLGAAIDAIGSALGGGGGGATRTVPREKLPRILFIWGAARLLPVTIQSMRMTEQKFDFMLNPVQAEVEIGLRIASAPPDDDIIGKGALTFSKAAKDVQAQLNLAKAVEAVADIIRF